MTPTIPRTFIRLSDGAYPIPEWHAPDPNTHAEVFVDDPPVAPAGFVVELAEQPDANHVLRYQLRQAFVTPMTDAEIDAQVVARIREKYSLDDELYFARIAVGSLMGTYTLLPDEPALLAQYQIDVEAAREWGRTEKEKEQ